MSQSIIHVKPTKNRVFEPEKWNAPDVVRLCACFAYALNEPALGKAYGGMLSATARDIFLGQAALQGGDFSQMNTPLGGCERFDMMSDIHLFGNLEAYFAGLVRFDPDVYQPTPEDHVIAVNHMLHHYYRRDSDGTWSHKDDENEATNKDDLGRVIEDLEMASFSFDGGDPLPLLHWTERRSTLQYFLVREPGILVQGPV